MRGQIPQLMCRHALAGERNRVARSALLLLALVLASLLLGACRPRTPDVGLPTLAFLPTATALPPTPTASRTPLPTWTFTPSNTPVPPTLTFTPSLTPSETNTFTPTLTLTLTPTDTPTITPSNTPIPSNTPVPSNTLRPSRTPSNTATPLPTSTPSNTPVPPTRTPRPSNTPVASDTPVPSPTVAAPQILQFAANTQSVVANTQIYLIWTTVADFARLDVLTAQGQVAQSFPVAVSGQYTPVVPGNLGRTVQFRLVVQRNGIETAQSLTVNVVCAASWFFGDALATASSACASGVAAVVPAAYQQFQGGFMLAYTINGQQYVFGMLNDGRYISYLSRWDGTTLVPYSPPPGLLAPEGVFNWAYSNTLAPIGSWGSALGWAVTAQAASQQQLQTEASPQSPAPFYADTVVNAVFYFPGGARDGFAGSWVRVR